MKREQQNLNEMGNSKVPEHSSKTEGYGLGCDILSFDENGREKYIEVQTTKGGLESPFFITANELKRSIKDGGQFVL